MQQDYTFNFGNEVEPEEPTGKTYFFRILLAFCSAQNTNKNFKTQNVVTETDNMRSIQHKGETFLSSFDFFQRIQRWMYEQGLFNFHAT